MENMKINFELKKYNILEVHEDHAIVRAAIVNVGDNPNQTSFSKKAITDALPTLYNIPLIGIYNSLDNDFKSHAQNEQEESERYAIGVVPESCNAKFERNNATGEEYLYASFVVWKNYFPDFFNVISNNEQKNVQTKISMEISVTNWEKVNGIFDVRKFVFEGISLLGERFETGIENAGFRVVRFEKGKIDLEDNGLFDQMVMESNAEMQILNKYSEKSLSKGNDNINNNIEKGVGEVMSMKKNYEEGTLAKEVNDVVTDNMEVNAQPVEEGVTEVKEVVEVQETATEPVNTTENVEEGKAEEFAKSTEEVKDDKAEQAKKANDKAEDKTEEEFEDADEGVAPAGSPNSGKNDTGVKKVDVEDKPLSKSERKTYEATIVSLNGKIDELKEKVEKYEPFQALYEEAKEKIVALEEYKEDAELEKLERQKKEYASSCNIKDFEDDDKDLVQKKVDDFDFSFPDFKAFMADMMKKYGIKSKYSNLENVIQYFSNDSVVEKYQKENEKTDEETVMDKFIIN